VLAVAALSSGEQRVYFVDKDDGRRQRSSDGEECAHQLLTFADPLAAQGRGADGEEGCARLRRHGAADERLARAGRAEEQQPRGHRARPSEQIWSQQRPDGHLLHDRLGVLQPRDVVPRHLRRLLQDLVTDARHQRGLALADGLHRRHAARRYARIQRGREAEPLLRVSAAAAAARHATGSHGAAQARRAACAAAAAAARAWGTERRLDPRSRSRYGRLVGRRRRRRRATAHALQSSAK
jgi:hypothetical protein